MKRSCLNIIAKIALTLQILLKQGCNPKHPRPDFPEVTFKRTTLNPRNLISDNHKSLNYTISVKGVRAQNSRETITTSRLPWGMHIKCCHIWFLKYIKVRIYMRNLSIDNCQPLYSQHFWPKQTATCGFGP